MGISWLVNGSEKVGGIKMGLKMTKKKTLMQQVHNIIEHCNEHPNCSLELELCKFILQDRARICSPLIKYKTPAMQYNSWGNTFICKAVDKTLHLAGIKVL